MDPHTPIDLRSDTVTRPTDAMRRVLAETAVGDDQFGEDASTNELQGYVAELLGKEDALWCPTGTMANQVALRVADTLRGSGRVDLDPATVQTNIVVFGVTADAPDAARIVARARERGVLLVAFGARRLRATTHLQVSREQCERAAAILVEIIESGG